MFAHGFAAFTSKHSPIRFGRPRRVKRTTKLHFEPLESRAMFSASSVFPAPAPGAVITGITPHTWVADSNGLYHAVTDVVTMTPVNLAQEWQGYYQQMLSGNAASLPPIARLEGNAEAVFENTGLKNLSAADQARDREDAQREFDAIAAALQMNLTSFATNPNVPLTEETYIWLGKTIQDNSDLYELGLQGHGLNDPPASRYCGFTNDFQNNVDSTTLFVGGGLDNNQEAIASFFDDAIITHLPFPVVVKNGAIVQLNQNGDRENGLLSATAALDDYMYGGVLTSADFSSSASCANHNVLQSSMRKLVEKTEINLSAAPSNGQIQSLLGPVSTTIAARGATGGLTLHAWTADADGQFFTTTDLAAEWKGYYQEAISGHAASLTPIERLEANAEAVFENTKLAQFDPAYLYLYRQDAQREFDAIDAALQIDQATLGTPAVAPLTEQSYLNLEKTIQSNPTLWELAVQGHGLNDPPSPRYRGYTNDFQNNVDTTTRYVGGGLNNGRNALTDFFDDNIMTHVPFPTVWQNGQLVQLNQNADEENTLKKAVIAMDESMFYRFYVSSDFKR
ncbi:MAG: hypothetical protein ACLP9L_09040 [Thermoguttaceae bacterium]